jgi:peptidoglycan hydrolase-like protein with peptidoglycan-binding domain
MATQARSIRFPVGRQGVNRAEDVSVIQQLLNEALVREIKFQSAQIKKLNVDGQCGPLTRQAIQAFQDKVLGWSGRTVDGTVHPDRQTWRSLNGNVSSPAQIKVSNVARRPSTIEGYSVFKQGDKEWGKEHLGNGEHTIHQWGCAMCTLTMAATLIGSPTKDWPENLRPSNLNPSVTNGILRKARAFSSSSLNMPKAANALGMTYVEYGKVTPIKPEDVTIIQANVQAGYPVAANVAYGCSTAGRHWILIVKRNSDGSFECIDPAYGSGLQLTSRPTCTRAVQASKKKETMAQGVLYGFGNGGSPNQQQYVVVRFACLSPAVGGYCASSE